MQKKTIDLNLLWILCQCNLNAFEVIWTFGNLQGSFSYGRHFVQQSKSVCAVSVEGIKWDISMKLFCIWVPVV